VIQVGHDGLQYRYRNSYGVSFVFHKGGSFAFFDIHSFLNSIVNAIVIFAIPLQVVRFVALNCIGAVSKIYNGVVNQSFSIFHQFHGLSARMMISAMGFRALTNQWQTPVDEMKGMSLADIETRMVESFAHEMTEDAGKPAMLQLGELKKMAAVVLAGLNSDGGDDISFEEFIHATSSNEFLDSKTMALFFDDDNKPHRLTRIFDPTRAQIKRINKKVRASLRTVGSRDAFEEADVLCQI